MKTQTWFTLIAASVLCGFTSPMVCAQDVDSFAPVVVKTVPEAGSKEVPSGEYLVKVTFSKEMADESWTWSSVWQGSEPKMLGKPHYEADHKTCVIKVKLEPGKTYGWWINSQKFHGFKDPQGRAAIPYLFVFQTKAN